MAGMEFTPDRDTVLCVSLSGRPSNIGTRFHNFLYRELGLNYLYKAFSTTDLPGAVAGVRALGIRGAGVSMPFKEAVLDLVDEVDPSAAAIGSANTVVNTDGHLTAYNTDYLAVRELLGTLPAAASAAVAGSGGMAKAVVAALRDTGVGQVAVVSRNSTTGPALAARYGYTWAPSAPDAADLLVNATPVGMDGGPEAADLPFPADTVRRAGAVFDVVALPARTPLVRLAEQLGTPVVTGAQVVALQAAAQFALYTGVRPTPDQVARASAFSRP